MNTLPAVILAFLLQLIALPGPVAAETPTTYSLIRIFIADFASLRPVWEAGLDAEGSAGKPGGWMEFVASAAELRALAGRGIVYEVVTRDLAAAAAKGLHPGPMDALGFGAGSMGGYYTYDEVGAQLDSMRLLYPGLISEKQDLGYTPEGRPIWVVRISDNPGLDEPSEPEALYTSLHHAREPAGMMTVIYYMWWLLENYGTDARAGYLVDNRQLWFIPVVNPDGYRYNQTTNPAGGGFWRKNRRDNGDGTRGIDLNRNYGPDEMWDSPNGGSSTNPGSDTYRGPAPFSEPETQTIDSFMRLRSIRTCLNYHTYSRMLVYPYGYLNAESGDSLIFRELAFDLTRVNRYISGTDQQTVNYSTRGNSDDYMYGDTTKFRTFAMTPEVGTSFWPPSSQILPMALENLEANIHYSFVAGPMPALRDVILTPALDSAGFLPGSPFSLSLSIRNRGLDTARDLAISISTGPAGLVFTDPPAAVTILPARSETTITVAGTVDSGAVAGPGIPLLVRITDASGYDRTDTARVFVGEPSVLFSDGAEAGTALWSTGGNWDAVAVAHGGAFSFHDSPSGSAPPWTAAGIETADPVDLAGYEAARLEFWTRWAIEPVQDFGRVKVSRDSGATWSVLGGSLSNAASGSGTQVPGSRGYDGYTPGLDWVRQEIDLTAFAGDRILVRFELAVDGSDTRDGWYLDDIRVIGYRAPVPGGAVSLSTASLAGAELSFGEWPGAGDGIDPWIGESELGPAPPPGTFDARWLIPGTNGSLTDIRDTLGAAGDTNAFTISISGGPADYPLALTWDRAGLAPGSWSMSDTLPGTPFLNEDMWKKGQAVVADPAVTAVRIVHTRTADAAVRLLNRWGLVSLPVTPADPSVGALFPNAAPNAYAFDGAYVPGTSLAPGTGYWLRNDGAETVSLTGVPLDRNLIGNPAGNWVLFGAVYCAIPRSAACPTCPSPPVVFGYDNGYFMPDTLVPGEAYWYRGTLPLRLDCRSTGPSVVPSAPRTGRETMSRLTLSPPDGGGATLYFSTRIPESGESGRFRMPPVPPGAAFDARFETENAVEYVGVTSDPIGIRVSGGGDGMVVRYDGASADDGLFALELSDGLGTPRLRPLRDGEVISVAPGTALRLVHSPSGGLPGEFRVHGNYPNPFNPTTSISFDLPAPASVSLIVRNVAGQEVDVPVRDRGMAAGRQVIAYDAGRLASGVYFYTLRAQPEQGRAAWTHHGAFILIR